MYLLVTEEFPPWDFHQRGRGLSILKDSVKSWEMHYNYVNISCVCNCLEVCWGKCQCILTRFHCETEIYFILHMCVLIVSPAYKRVASFMIRFFFESITLLFFCLPPFFLFDHTTSNLIVFFFFIIFTQISESSSQKEPFAPVTRIAGRHQHSVVTSFAPDRQTTYQAT